MAAKTIGAWSKVRDADNKKSNLQSLPESAQDSVAKSRQMIFSFPEEAFSVNYFIPHSGLAEADEAFQQIAQLMSADNRNFCLLYVWGEAGCGKSHLIQAKVETLLAEVVSEAAISVVVASPETVSEDAWVRAFIDEYEKLRREGGILIVEARVSPHQLTENPHLLSRLLNGVSAELAAPKESEIEPIVKSILERKNLRISDRVLKYLLARVPRDFLSFEKILATISDVSLSEGRPARFGVVKELLAQALEESEK